MNKKSLSRVKFFLWKILPLFIQKFFFKIFYSGYYSEVKKFKYLKSENIKLNDKVYPLIHLLDNTKLLGYGPKNKFVKLTKSLFANQIPDFYTGLVNDYILRYKYSHLGIAIDKFEFPKSQRCLELFFHPQHKNMLRELNSIKNKEEISKKFLPQKSWNIIEVGCYIGFGSLRFSKILTDGKLISVEAVKENYEIACKNRELNKVDNWEIINAVLWDKKKQNFSFDIVNGQADFLKNNHHIDKLEKVDTITLEELLKKISKVDLLSLTINGAEVEAIKSIVNIDKKFLPLRILVPGWYNLENSPRSEIIEPILKELGYKTLCTSGNFIYAWLDKII